MRSSSSTPMLPSISAVPLALHRAGLTKQFRRVAWKLTTFWEEPKLRITATVRAIHQKEASNITGKSPKTPG